MTALASTKRACAGSATAGALVLGAAVAGLLSASPVRAVTDDAELIYECGLAIEFAAKKGVQLPVSASRAMNHFDDVTRNDPNRRKEADR